MKVLMLAPQPFLEPRGTPISVYQRVQGLASLGHSIDLVTYHRGQDVTIPGVTIYRIPHVSFIKEVKVGPSWYKPLLDLLLMVVAIRLLMRTRYDAIHSHEEAAFFAMPLAALFRTKHLYDMHSSLPRQLANFNVGNYRALVRLFAWLERRTLHTCDALITIGSDLEQYAQQVNPAVTQVMIENLPVQTTAAPIDRRSVEHLKQQLGLEQRLPIVYTGTFERYQGIGLLIESAKVVRAQCPEACFVLAGGKPQQIAYWKAEVKKHGLEDTILFVGTVPVEEVSTYVAMADILVSPRIEGTSVPLKIYSYLLAGKPIVATNLPAHTLVLDTDSAVLTEPTAESFANGMLTLIQNSDLRTSLGMYAKQRAQAKYDRVSYMEKLERIYRVLDAPEPAQEHQRAS